jgi:adenylosuccinate lyase
METGKISGSVGNFANVDVEIQTLTMKYLNLNEALISTQILSRERHAMYINSIAIIGSILEEIAFEIRNLQRTEIREVEEFFDVKQKGSSSMPHKKNPISSENITGLARVLRGYQVSAMQNIAL